MHKDNNYTAVTDYARDKTDCRLTAETPYAPTIGQNGTNVADLYAEYQGYSLCGYALFTACEAKALSGCSLNRNAIKLKTKVGGDALDHRRNVGQQFGSLCHYRDVDIAYCIASCGQQFTHTAQQHP